MKKRFVIILDSSTEEQDEKFQDYIKENGYNWWHWINDNWLLVDTSDTLTAAKLRTDLQEFYSDVHNLVLEIREKNDTWSGYGPASEDKNMFDWLKANW